MPSQPLDSLRLAVMQEWLPLGLAVVDRARRGGVSAVVEGFTQAEDPLDQLRQEGEPVARQLRDNLDRLQPGLGNPVMKVQVRDLEPLEARTRCLLSRVLCAHQVYESLRHTAMRP